MVLCTHYSRLQERQKNLVRKPQGKFLCNAASKIFAGIILRILTSVRENHVRENQAGFRPGSGSIDHIFNLRQILEHRHTFRCPTILGFLGLKVASTQTIVIRFRTVYLRKLYQLTSLIV